MAQQGEVHYTPIDISSEFLYSSSQALLSDYDMLSVTAVGLVSLSSMVFKQRWRFYFCVSGAQRDRYLESLPGLRRSSPAILETSSKHLSGRFLTT